VRPSITSSTDALRSLRPLTEISNARQIPGEPRRRWFESASQELIVWYAVDGSILGFQLCYDRDAKERAVTWTSHRGYSHESVDDGEAVGIAYRQTPILVPDGAFEMHRVLERFAELAGNLPRDIVNLVSAKLAEYPNDAAMEK
jgi:hypothetical protein